MNAYQLWQRAKYEDIVGRGYDPLKLARAIGEPDEPPEPEVDFDEVLISLPLRKCVLCGKWFIDDAKFTTCSDCDKIKRTNWFLN